MGKLNFCRRFVHLDGRLIRFEKRPYLRAIYACGQRNLVLRCSRQTEKSTFLVNTIVFEAGTVPRTRILMVCPRDTQGRVFCRSRLFPAIRESPLVRRCLLGTGRQQLQVANMQFANGSELYVRSAYHSADACRGLSADLLLVDEFQDIAAGDLPVLQETLSHSARGRTILTGTPKSADNHLEGIFRQSTASEWSIHCPACGRGVILDERALGPGGPACPDCRSPLDPRQGRWIPRNPDAQWGDGFWVNHPMVPWITYEEILQRQQSYDVARFKNEVLGLPTVLGDHVVTRAEMEACCTDQPMAASLRGIPAAVRPGLVAGIDWGGGSVSRTVLVVGAMWGNYTFQLFYLERFPAAEEPDVVHDAVAQRCARFGVRWIAADGGGNGTVYNRLLLDRLQRRGPLHAITYCEAGQQPLQEGILWKWTVGRSASIGALFSRVKRQQLLFPRLEDCGSFLDEFACEVAEYDEENRRVRYTHPETQQDDALHATNYALLLAILLHSAQQGYVG